MINLSLFRARQQENIPDCTDPYGKKLLGCEFVGGRGKVGRERAQLLPHCFSTNFKRLSIGSIHHFHLIDTTKESSIKVKVANFSASHYL